MQITLSFNTAEVSTILAALAHWHSSGAVSADQLIGQIATQDGRHDAAEPDDVLNLSSRIAEQAGDQQWAMLCDG